jgi:hypothetical protein
MKPIHKLNGGDGATLCNNCSTVISKGLTDELFCDSCKNTPAVNAKMLRHKVVLFKKEVVNEGATKFFCEIDFKGSTICTSQCTRCKKIETES